MLRVGENRFGGAPFVTQNRVTHEVVELAPLLRGAARGAFWSHPDLLHHAARRRIATEMRGLNALQVQRFKAVIENGKSGFGDETSVPERHAELITEFGARVLWLNAKADAAH